MADGRATREQLTDAAKQLLEATGYYAARLAGRRFPGVCVLGYHGVLPAGTPRDGLPFAELHVDAATLDAHLALIARHATPLTLAEAERAWRGEASLPDRGVLVTFDDGHHTLLTEALPLLEKHQVPAVVFACTGPIMRECSFWFDAVARAAGEAAVEAAKGLPHAEWAALVAAHEAAVAPGDVLAPLTRDQLRTLAAHPLVTIGAHTESHPILARAPREVQQAEVRGACEAIEAATGRRPTAFAYPNGRPVLDFDATTEGVLVEAGIVNAFSTSEGFATPDEPPLARSRFVMLASVTAAELAHRMAHAWR